MIPLLDRIFHKPEETRVEKPAAAPVNLIFEGLIKQEHMGPVKAMIFCHIFQQFPYRYIPNNQFYFKPTIDVITNAMHIKPVVYYYMVNQLVDEGYLVKRKAKSGGQELLIVFKAVDKFIPNGKT